MMKKLAFSLAIAAAAAGAMAMVATDSSMPQLSQAGKNFEQLSHGQGVYTSQNSEKYQWRKSANSQSSELEGGTSVSSSDPLAIIEAAYATADAAFPMVPEYPAFTGTVPDSLVVTTVADKKVGEPKVQYTAHLFWMTDSGFTGLDKRYYYNNMKMLEYGTAFGDNMFTYSYQNNQKGPTFYRRRQEFNPAKNIISGKSDYRSSVDANTIKPDTIFD